MYFTKQQRFRIQILAPQLIGSGTQWVAGHLMSSPIRRIPVIITSLNSHGLRSPNTMLVCGQCSISAIIPVGHVCVRGQSLQSCLSAMLCTVARQAPLSMGFSRQEYWGGFATPSYSRSSPPRDWTWVSCRFFATSTTWEVHSWLWSIWSYECRGFGLLPISTLSGDDGVILLGILLWDSHQLWTSLKLPQLKIPT